jgi:hypothetical protein
VSRKRAEIKLKGEALFPKLGKEDIDFVFEPQRGDESDHYGSGLTFNITVGPKLAVAVASIFANLVVTLANIFLQVS